LVVSPLANWTREKIEGSCARAYTAYETALRNHYREYFEAHPDLASDHPLKAKDIAAALPPDTGFLEEFLPQPLRHRHHLSGRSSQVLALAVLGLARSRDPSLRWLDSGLSLPGLLASPAPGSRFEVELEPALLNEYPHVTTIDFLVEDESAVVCVEAKFGEKGLGPCSCKADASATGACSERVLDRTLYWETARDVFSLPDRVDRKPCPISASYQAIRNGAAARALAGPNRRAVFVLLYDERNPYFRQTGEWPGWPALLRSALADAEQLELLTFRAASWQELVPLLPLTDDERRWLRKKHEIG
jgi:hypothetical protein